VLYEGAAVYVLRRTLKAALCHHALRYGPSEQALKSQGRQYERKRDAQREARERQAVKQRTDAP